MKKLIISGSELDAMSDAMACLVKCDNDNCGNLFSEPEAYQYDYICQCGSKLIDDKGNTLNVTMNNPALWY